LRLVTFLLPEAYLEGVDRLVGMNMYSSRSTAIRYAVMDLLKRELWRQEREGKQERKTKKARRVSKEGRMAKMKINQKKNVHKKKQKSLRNYESSKKKEKG